MKNPNLYKLFRKYNRKYFYNALPNDICFYYENLENEGVLGWCEPWNYEVSIHSSLSSSEIRSTFLHELIHMYEYLVEDKEYKTEADYHTIEFYWHAIRIYQLTGYPVA